LKYAARIRAKNYIPIQRKPIRRRATRAFIFESNGIAPDIMDKNQSPIRAAR
jgi:hypothetical protein